MPDPIRPWMHFMYPAGTAFAVDGPALFDGTGRVIKNSKWELEFELDMPQWRILLWEVTPAFNVRINCRYKQDGAGNIVKATDLATGKVSKDDNATILTYATGRRRQMSTRVNIGSAAKEDLTFDANWVSDKKIKVMIGLDGKTHDFDLLLA